MHSVIVSSINRLAASHCVSILETDRISFSFSAPKITILTGFSHFRFQTKMYFVVFCFFFVFGRKHNQDHYATNVTYLFTRWQHPAMASNCTQLSYGLCSAPVVILCSTLNMQNKLIPHSVKIKLDWTFPPGHFPSDIFPPEISPPGQFPSPPAVKAKI